MVYGVPEEGVVVPDSRAGVVGNVSCVSWAARMFGGGGER